MPPQRGPEPQASERARAPELPERAPQGPELPQPWWPLSSSYVTACGDAWMRPPERWNRLARHPGQVPASPPW